MVANDNTAMATSAGDRITNATDATNTSNARLPQRPYRVCNPFLPYGVIASTGMRACLRVARCNQGCDHGTTPLRAPAFYVPIGIIMLGLGAYG